MPELPDKKYKTIVIDPPWNVKPMILKKYPNPLPYKTMTTDELINFPIHKITDDNCSMFLWTTHTFLPDAIKLMAVWGFKYHCLLTWHKVSGYSNCGIFRDTELVLFGYKGKMNINQKGKFIRCLFFEPKGRHSRKPNTFFNMIKNNTQEPRISLFERELRDGFDVWGDVV